MALLVTALAPSAKATMPTRFGVSGRRLGVACKRVESLQYLLQVIGVVRHPECLLGTRRIAEHHVHELRLHTLDRHQQARIERGLHQELGLGSLGQLGVDDLIAECAQCRCTRHLAQEVGMPDQRTVLQRRLEDDIGASVHGLNRQFHTTFETRVALGDVDDVGVLAFKPLEKGRLMGQSLVLDQAILLAVGRLWHRGKQVLKVQRREVLAFKKAAKVGGRVQPGAISGLHGRAYSCGVPGTAARRLTGELRVRRRGRNRGKTARRAVLAGDRRLATRSACRRCAPRPSRF